MQQHSRRQTRAHTRTKSSQSCWWSWAMSSISLVNACTYVYSMLIQRGHLHRFIIGVAMPMVVNHKAINVSRAHQWKRERVRERERDVMRPRNSPGQEMRESCICWSPSLLLQIVHNYKDKVREQFVGSYKKGWICGKAFGSKKGKKKRPSWPRWVIVLDTMLLVLVGPSWRCSSVDHHQSSKWGAFVNECVCVWCSLSLSQRKDVSGPRERKWEANDRNLRYASERVVHWPTLAAIVVITRPRRIPRHLVIQ